MLVLGYSQFVQAKSAGCDQFLQHIPADCKTCDEPALNSSARGHVVTLLSFDNMLWAAFFARF